MFSTLQLPELSFPSLITPCNAECKAEHDAMFGGGSSGPSMHAIGGGGHRRQLQAGPSGLVGVKVMVEVGGVSEDQVARLQEQILACIAGGQQYDQCIRAASHGRRLRAAGGPDEEAAGCAGEAEMWRRKAEGYEAELMALRGGEEVGVASDDGAASAEV